MNPFYEKILSAKREFVAKLIDTTVNTSIRSKSNVIRISTTYKINGRSGVWVEKINLLDRSTSRAELAKVIIHRDVSTKFVELEIKFLSDDDVLLHSQTDTGLLMYTDSEILSRIAITTSKD